MLINVKAKRITLYVLLGIVVALPYAGFLFLKHWYQNKVEEIKNAEIILIDKELMKLSVIDYKGKMVCEYPIACGKNYGNKQEQGDMRTPEGVFHISEIVDASSWTHDFKDGKGEIDGAYGPYFMRLETPGHKGIGIHGTHLPESIGTRITEGCIRLKNEDLVRLKDYAHAGMVVIVTPSSQDALVSTKGSLQ